MLITLRETHYCPDDRPLLSVGGMFRSVLESMHPECGEQLEVNQSNMAKRLHYFNIVVLSMQLIHGCLLFQMGQFFYAAKAFDALEQLDPGSNYWEGKRGACVGVFQLILANKESRFVSLLTKVSPGIWFCCRKLSSYV